MQVSGLAAWFDSPYNQAMATPALLRSPDPRPIALLCLALGILTWQTSLPGAACHLVFFLGLIFYAPRRAGFNAGLLRSGLGFVVLWSAVKLGLLLWEADWRYAPAMLATAGELGLRLAALVSIGVALTALVSPPALCRAAAWALRPVLGRRAWEPALALALMLHFVPLIWETAGRLRLALRCRQLPLSRRRQTLLFLQTLLRALALRTWTQTLAIAARDLDRDEAWRWETTRASRNAARPLWLACLVCLAAALWLAYGLPA
ncbi:hypothetical protein JCM14635_08570 [Megalodesulfovibrio paquesii]